MSTLFSGTGDSSGAPVSAHEDLLAFFRSGEKPARRFGIGIEYERLPLSRDTGRAIPYAAAQAGVRRSPSIESFLEMLAEGHGWRPAREGGRVIALERSGTRVTLEPGAQVELSGQVHQTLDAARDEVMGFVREAGDVASSMGFAFVGLGYHPLTDFTEIGWVPKSRYSIMAPYLGSRGHLAHGMMKATAGCQINLDYASEAEAMEKLRVAMGVSSVVTALCANSPLARGQVSGFASKRSHIWMHTDPDRCGLLSFAFRDEAGYADYLSYALDVPMLFVVRDGRWLDLTGRTFRAFLKGDNLGLTPILADWQLHLTTLFPEVRLKSYVEVRGSDSAPAEMILAQAALWKGILYDETARQGAWNLVKRASFEERMSFHREASRIGLAAVLRDASALELAQELVALADRGLPSAEAGYLEPLRKLVHEHRASPAEILMERWTGEWGRDPRRLVAALASDSAQVPPA